MGQVKDSYGFSFKQAIFSGCKNPESEMGIYAGSPDSYRAFEKVFGPILHHYQLRMYNERNIFDRDYKNLQIEPFTAEQ